MHTINNINNNIKYHSRQKRNYSSIYSPEDNHSYIFKKEKLPKLTSSFSIKDYLGKENTPQHQYTINKSIDHQLNQIQKNFTQMKLNEPSASHPHSLTAEDIVMDDLLFPRTIQMKNYSIDWSWTMDDYEYGYDDDTQSSSFNYENDIPDINKNVKITGKIIANALESEKTLNRIFEMNPKLIPNERNGIVLYDTMKQYKEQFDREMFILNCKANGLGFGFYCNNYTGNANEMFDDYSMEFALDSNTLNDFFDDDMMMD